MKILNCIALIIILIGALNSGLWGFFHFDFIAWLFNETTTPWLTRIIYAIIGLAGIWGVIIFCKKCKCMCAHSPSCKCSEHKHSEHQNSEHKCSEHKCSEHKCSKEK